MKLKKNKSGVAMILAIVLVLISSACADATTPPPTQDPAVIQTQAAQTVVAGLTVSAPQTTQAPPATSVPTQGQPSGPTPDPDLPQVVIPTPAAGEPAAVANYNTTIYSGPGTNYVVYSAFLGSASARVVGKSEDGLWWAVSIPVAPNGNGWVDGGWVTVTNADNVPALPTPPVPATVALVPPGPDEPQLVTIANTHVRTGPAATFPAFGIAPQGASARVLGKSEDGLWWVVRLDPAIIGAGHGWVEAQYTQATNADQVPAVASPEAVEAVSPPPPAEGAPSATTLDYVNVRSGPGTNFPVLVVAPPGASGEVSGRSADSAWWQVKISTDFAADGLGWVSASYVTTQNAQNVPVVEAPAAPPTVGTTPPPPSQAGCALAAQNPADGTEFSISAPFQTTWLLQNTGTSAWDQAEYDLLFLGAANNIFLHTGPDRYDLTASVEAGGTYQFTVPMMAPFGPGTFGEVWQLSFGNQPVCQFYVYIEVN